MLGRILIAVIALILSVPASAACPLAQPKAVPDCCKTKCPKPAKLQPCFECVADVRTTAIAPEPELPVVLPDASISVLDIPVVTLAVVARDPISNERQTFLRIGVLRL